MDTSAPKRIPVKPAKDMIVIDLESGLPIPADGAEVLESSYIRRRINDGDLIVLESLPKPTTKNTR